MKIDTPQETQISPFLFWTFCLVFCAFWVALPAIFHTAYRPDVIELQCAGREWVLSTTKHPMLPAWFLETLNLLTGRMFAAPFLAAQLLSLLTLWSVWFLGKKVLSFNLACLGTLAMLPYWYFTIESIKYNQNTALIAFWTLSISMFFLAVRTNALRYWFASGIFLGLTFHSKYTAALLVISMLFFMFTQVRTRRLWKGIGPYLTALTALLVFLPHLIWLYQHDFITLGYAQSTRADTSSWFNLLFLPLRFVFNSFGILIPTLLILAPIVCLPWKKRELSDQAAIDGKRLLSWVIFFPFAVHLFLASVFSLKLNVDYGSSFWPFFGIWLLLNLQTVEHKTAIRRSMSIAIAFEIFLICCFIAQSHISPYLQGTPRRFHFPMNELGAACDKIWSEHSAIPCPYVGGDWWIAGNAVMKMKDQPSLLFYWSGIEDTKYPPTGPWANDADLNENGGLILWNVPEETTLVSPASAPEYVLRRYPKAKILPEPIVLPYQLRATIPPVVLGCAFVVPEKNE